MSTAPTERQGQFLAYIHQYGMIHGCAPAEADMQRYFQITPPSVHSMVLTLERRGFISALAGLGVQHHRDRSAGILATLETHPTLTLSTHA